MKLQTHTVFTPTLGVSPIPFRANVTASFLFYFLLDRRRLRNVQLWVDFLGNCLDLGREVGFNLVDVVTIVVGNEVNRETEMTKTARTSDAVKIRLRILGEIEVDYDVHGLNIDTTSNEIGANQVAAVTLAEVVEDTVTVRLLHAGVNVVAGIAQLGDFLSQELDTVDAIAENN